jgi:hypothetical protein
MLTTASWLLGQLPDRVEQRQRGDLVRALSQSQDLAVMVRCGRAPAIRIYDGARLLVEIPAKSTT